MYAIEIRGNTPYYQHGDLDDILPNASVILDYLTSNPDCYVQFRIEDCQLVYRDGVLSSFDLWTANLWRGNCTWQQLIAIVTVMIYGDDDNYSKYYSTSLVATLQLANTPLVGCPRECNPLP